MRKRIILLLTLFCIQALSLLSAADNTVSLSIIAQMAASRDPNQKLEAVHSLESMIVKGGLSSEDQKGVIELLDLLATEGIVNVSYDSLRIDNDHSHVRNEAARVLGITKDPSAVDSLVTVLLNEPLTHVLSTAVISCGQLGYSHKKINAVFYLILTGKKQVYRSDTLVYNTLLSVQQIMRTNDSPIVSDILRDGVIHVADTESGYLRKTRRLAEEILAQK